MPLLTFTDYVANTGVADPLYYSDLEDGCNSGSFFGMMYRKRLHAFFGLGFVGFLLFLSSGISTICGNLSGFIIAFLLGHVVIMSGFLFLFGLCTLMKSIFTSYTNMIICFFASIFFNLMILLSAYLFRDGGLCLLFLVLEYQSLTALTIKILEDYCEKMRIKNSTIKV